MASTKRLWRHPDAGNSVAVPAEGEVYTTVDAKRLLGTGGYTDKDPRGPRSDSVRGSTKRKTGVKPVREG